MQVLGRRQSVSCYTQQLSLYNFVFIVLEEKVVLVATLKSLFNCTVKHFWVQRIFLHPRIIKVLCQKCAFLKCSPARLSVAFIASFGPLKKQFFPHIMSHGISIWLKNNGCCICVWAVILSGCKTSLTFALNLAAIFPQADGLNWLENDAAYDVTSNFCCPWISKVSRSYPFKSSPPTRNPLIFRVNEAWNLNESKTWLQVSRAYWSEPRASFVFAVTEEQK